MPGAEDLGQDLPLEISLMSSYSGCQLHPVTFFITHCTEHDWWLNFGIPVEDLSNMRKPAKATTGGLP